MKFTSFINSENQERIGILINGKQYDLSDAANSAGIELPALMSQFLADSNKNIAKSKEIENWIKNNNYKPIENVLSLAPVPHPTSCRDGYAFQQHVESARRNRGVDMIPEFYQYPIFYFTNHNSIIGEGELVVEKDHLLKLDFELEWAIVIGKQGRNIIAEEADDYIAGFTIMNDFSARLLQMEEMMLNLGPAKGKDFATAIGPFMATADELEQYRISTPRGSHWNLEMKAFHNGKQVSTGNTKDMTFTFAEIIERVSYGVDVYPGDVIGSGTVGTGCYLELNGTWAREAKEKGEVFSPIWLENNDEIELEVTGLGKLKNTVKLTENDYSILAKKKI